MLERNCPTAASHSRALNGSRIPRCIDRSTASETDVLDFRVIADECRTVSNAEAFAMSERVDNSRAKTRNAFIFKHKPQLRNVVEISSREAPKLSVCSRMAILAKSNAALP